MKASKVLRKKLALGASFFHWAGCVGSMGERRRFVTAEGRLKMHDVLGGETTPLRVGRESIGE